MTATATTPATVAEAHALLREVPRILRRTSRENRKPVRDAVFALDDALDIYKALTNDELHWEAVYPGLDSPDPDAEALALATQEVGEAANQLADAIAAVIAAGDGGGAR